MLQSIRTMAQGWLAWVIGTIIIIPFAFWGIQEYLGGGGSSNVATVDGEDISSNEFIRYYKPFRQQQIQRLQSILSSSNSPLLDKLLNEDNLKQQALDNLIKNRLLVYTALKSGYQLDDSQLRKRIELIPVFQKDGEFSKAAYDNYLFNSGQSSAQFEQNLRTGLIIEQMQGGVILSQTVTPHDIDNVLRLRKQQREIGYLLLSGGKYKNDITVSDDDVKKYYDEHSSLFMTPELVSVDYIELKATDIAKNIKVDEKDLRQYYEENVSSFTTEGQVKARHILVAIKDKDNEATALEAKAKARQLLRRLEAGESFETLAKENSDDPGTAKKGGDLGYIRKGDMEKAFEDTVFDMKKGEISEPVRTSFGYHIIKVEDVIPVKTQSFDEARTRVEAVYRAQQAEDQFLDKAETLANLAYEVPDTLQDAANALELEIKSSPLFTNQGGTGIAAKKPVVDAAFSETVLVDGNNSEPIEVGPNHLVVVRLKEHKTPSARPLEDVKAGIISQLHSEKTRDQVRIAGQKLLDRLKKGESVETLLSKEDGVEWKSPGFIGRKESKVDSAIVKAAFESARPSRDKPSLQGVELGSDDYAIVAVFSVRDGDASKATEEERLSVRRELQRIYGQGAFDSLLAQIRNKADITVYKNNL